MDQVDEGAYREGQELRELTKIQKEENIVIANKQQAGMYDTERSRVRHAGSVKELDEIVRGIRIRNIPLFGPFEDGINPLPELQLLKTILSQTRKLVNEGRIHR
jgi:hypothetical protein